MIKKIIFTGGHLSPALAIIEKLSKDPNWKIFFFGRKRAFFYDREESFEYKTIQKLGIEFIDMSPVRIKKGLSLDNILSLFLFPVSLVKTFIVLLKINPDLIFTFGGYVALPVGLANILLRKKLLIHEQTLRAGWTNIFLAKFADKVLLGWKESLSHFPKEKTEITGNPLRKEMVKQTKNDWTIPVSGEHLPLIYITGGSTGSHAINFFIEQILPNLLKKYRIIHQSGSSYYQDFLSLKQSLEKLPLDCKNRYFLFKNLEASQISQIMKKADIIVGRAGANTVCEVAVFAKPAIFIPLPQAAYAEQKLNALKISSHGSAVICSQQNLNEKTFLNCLEKILANYDFYVEKALSYSQSNEIQIHLHAVSKVVEIINYYQFH